jgi:hypothetical protein
MRPSAKKFGRPNSRPKRKVHHAIIDRRTNGEEQVKRAKTNAAGPATQPHRSLIPLSSCLLAAISSETTVPIRQHSRGVPHLPSTGCGAATQRIAFLQPYAMGQRTNPLIEQELEEAAMTGQPARACAHFPFAPGNSPSRIANCHQHHRNHRSASIESSNVFAEPTLRQNVARRNRKTLRACEQAVEDETSLWNAEENVAEIILA